MKKFEWTSFKVGYPKLGVSVLISDGMSISGECVIVTEDDDSMSFAPGAVTDSLFWAYVEDVLNESHFINDHQSECIKNWIRFLGEINELNDLLLSSILNQSEFLHTDDFNKKVVIKLAAHSTYFRNKVNEERKLWLPLLDKYFPGCGGFYFMGREANESGRKDSSE